MRVLGGGGGKDFFLKFFSLFSWEPLFLKKNKKKKKEKRGGGGGGGGGGRVRYVITCLLIVPVHTIYSTDSTCIGLASCHTRTGQRCSVRSEEHTSELQSR